MSESNYVPVAPELETFRGYAESLDAATVADGSIAIPFIAFAKASGADVDKPILPEDFEKFLNDTAAAYGATITKHETYPSILEVNDDKF